MAKKVRKKKKGIVKENTQRKSEIFEDLYDFYDKCKDWIMDYADYANKFDAGLVQRESVSSLRNIYDILGYRTVLVLTANSVEQNILTRKLYDEQCAGAVNKVQLSEISIKGFVYQFANVGNVRIVHLHTKRTSSYPDGGSADAVIKALKWFHPELVVSLGVAFGIDSEKQNIGDVLLSSAIIPYDIFNKDTDGMIKLRNRDIMYTHDALNAWDVLIRTPDFSLDENRYSLIRRELEFKWHYGALLSGGSVLSNEKKKRALLKAAEDCGEENVIGGEMEGVGVYSECKKADIPCIVIKGICDWGAEKNSWETIINFVNKQQQGNSPRPGTCPSNEDVKNCVQAYAMDHATEALFRLLRFDSEFLDMYSSTEKHGKGIVDACKRKLSLCRQGFALKKEKIFQVAGIYFLISFALSVLIFFMDRFAYVFVVKGYVGKLIAILTAGLPVLTAAFFVGEAKTLHPISVHHAWVDFNFVMLNLAEQRAKIILNDERSISHVIVSWWLSAGKIQQGNQEIGYLRSHDTMEIETLDRFDPKTILQIEYEMKNGERYAHLISAKKKRRAVPESENIVYCERIFRKDGLKERIVGVQNAIIKGYVEKTH